MISLQSATNFQADASLESLQNLTHTRMQVGLSHQNWTYAKGVLGPILYHKICRGRGTFARKL